VQLKKVLARWENQLDVTVKKVRTNRGTEFLAEELREYLAEKGIIHDLTAPYTPQQNGVAGRFNRTVKENVLHVVGCTVGFRVL
jgi:transposase InsO family protein